MSDFKMEIIDEYDYVIQEKGNTYVSLRKIKWGDNDPKLDLRKYITDSNGDEKVQKGVCFEDEGAHELVKVLCETGYGDTKEIIDSIKDRDNFTESLCRSLSNDDRDLLERTFPDMEFPEIEDDEEDYIDIRNEVEVE